jgi:hypothetical protein
MGYDPLLPKVKAGNYTGNDTVDRAIPHNLGVIPKVVYIVNRNGFALFTILGSNPTSIARVGNSAYTVASMDSTNFYVGDAASYFGSANDNLTVFDWVAWG